MEASERGSGGPGGSDGGADAKARVLQATNLVELIGQSVKLIRRGRVYVGLCPFHQEKTPSFKVDPEKQFFYCFGCKAKGNAIDFVIQRDRVEFKEAVVSLAKAANIDLPNWGGRGGVSQSAGERQMLLDANSAACMLFEKLLAHPEMGKPAREYLEQRGFNAESVQRFHIGLAANAWDTLLRSPAMKKFTPPQLSLAGLVKSREGGNGFYDTFRNRLMFPIRDDAGRIIGFGGRVMPGSEDPAKYLNSPETPLFSKGRVAFGLDLAKQKIVETRTVAVVEGYTDVMMAHQFGASNVVSVLGTAMTPDHVKLLRRFADRIVLLFDADVAGDAAVDRAVELFLTQPVEVAIASMPDGVDPDEYLLAHGADGFQKLLDEAQDALAYKWKQLVQQFSASENNLTGQQNAVQTYLDLLAGARGAGPIDEIRWGAALARVSRLTQIPVEELNKRFRSRPQHRGGPPSDNRWGRRAGIPRRPAQANDGGMPTTNVPSAGYQSEGDDALAAGDATTNRAERWILGTLLLEPSRWSEVQLHLHPDDFQHAVHRRLAEIFWAHQRDEGEPVFNEFVDLLDEAPVKDLAFDLVNEVDEQVNREQGLNESVEKLRWQRSERDRQKTTASLGEEGADEVDQLRKLTEMARVASKRNANF